MKKRGQAINDVLRSTFANGARTGHYTYGTVYSEPVPESGYRSILGNLDQGGRVSPHGAKKERPLSPSAGPAAEAQRWRARAAIRAYIPKNGATRLVFINKPV